MKKILFIILLIILHYSSVAIAKEVKAVNITQDSFHQRDATAYKNKIVWVDLRHNDDKKLRNDLVLYSPTTSDIYLYDVESKETKRITKTKTWKLSPIITDNFLMWKEMKNYNSSNNRQIILKNLNTGVESIFDKGTPIEFLNNDRLVYIDKEISKTCILDLKTNSKKVLFSEKKSTYGNISLHTINDKIDYMIGHASVWDSETKIVEDKTYVVNLASLKRQFICNSDYSAGLPDIYDNEIVWSQRHKKDTDKPAQGYGNYDIYTKNILTGKTERITNTNNITEVKPQITDNYILFCDSFAYNFKVYDKTTKTILSINPPVSFNNPNDVKLCKELVVWVVAGDVHFAEL